MLAIDRDQLCHRGGALSAWILGGAPVLYLALRGGGWDPLVRGEAGLAAWWVLALGITTGVLPRRPFGRAGWTAVTLLGGFAAWTGVALLWTMSRDSTFTELGREATYLGFLALGVATITVATRRAALNGLTCGLGIVALLAVLSALYPAGFGSQPELVFFPGSRLSYPLGYSDAEGELLALTLPLVLTVAVDGRTRLGRAVAGAGLPVVVLGLVLTGSRGGVLTAVVALVVLCGLGANRLRRLMAMVTSGAGTAVVVAALIQRQAVRDGLSGPLAVTQRHQLTAVLALSCAGVLVVQLLVDWGLARVRRPGWVARSPTRRQARLTTALVVTAVVVGGLAAGIPARLSHAWHTFKQPDATATASVIGRLGTLGGSHRYQYWTVALHAFGQHPLLGIGPGDYQFYWAQHEPFYESILNAHSLYLETMAETGVVGTVLLGGMLVCVAAVGLRRVRRAPAAARSSLTAALAVFCGFCVAAAVDWVWQLPAIVMVMCLAAAVILVPDAPLVLVSGEPAGRVPAETAATEPAARGTASRAGASGPGARRLGGVALAGLALAAVALPFAATTALRSSQTAAAGGHFAAALSDAVTAQRLEPGTAGPWAQRALLLEQVSRFSGAAAAIERATVLEPGDWQLWLIRARIDAEAGQVGRAVAAFRRAHTLDPLSPLTQISGG